MAIYFTDRQLRKLVKKLTKCAVDLRSVMDALSAKSGLEDNFQYFNEMRSIAEARAKIFSVMGLLGD